MRNRFDRQLEQLNNELIQMGSMIEHAIEMAVSALVNQDTEKAKEAMAYDVEIDHQERDIESLCMKLLLQQQPVAKDLRLISSALKMITDMERIGDQTSDIAEIIMEVSGSEDVAVYIEGCHSCMSARGIKKHNAKTVTTTLRGAFDTDSTLKWHFMMQAGK